MTLPEADVRTGTWRGPYTPVCYTLLAKRVAGVAAGMRDA